jgi:hypothetical protein
VALDFDLLVSSGYTSRQALDEIRERTGWYDPSVVEALAAIIKTEPRYEPRTAEIAEMVSGMILDEDVFASTGLLIIAKGQEVTPTLKQRLRNFSRTGGIRQPIKVLVPVRET